MPLFSQDEELQEGILYLAEDYTFPYELSDPDKKTKLPSKLREISGIQSLGDGIIAGVEDERGNIYLIDFHSGEIKKEIDFGEKGDYEGLAIVGSTAWVIKSNGNLYRVKDYKKGEGELKTKKFETPLGKANDVEGLAYDKANDRLLLACKGHPFIDDRDGKHTKAIYAFDLDEKELFTEPILLIDLKNIQDIKDYNWFSSIGISIMSRLDENKGDVSFQPSDIAIHPVTGNYYITGAVGDLLLVYTPDGELLAAVELKDAVFKQAEGISFSARANMYISNEGGDGKANILKFTPKY
jgi:hypothetical protein